MSMQQPERAVGSARAGVAPERPDGAPDPGALPFDALEFYKETWANIRETDQISFKLLSFVPLISGSGAGLLVFLLDNAVLPFAAILGLSVLSALVTVGFYRW
jgi:hypothetical protein